MGKLRTYRQVLWRDICKDKQNFWTLHNSFFHKLYSTSKRDSFQQAKQQESTEKLLIEKDEEIRKMQAMIQQMASQLSHAQSGPNSIDDSTTV